MVVKMILKNFLGEFVSEAMDITEDQYTGLKDVSKKFYLGDVGFEMHLEDGFMVVPPDIVKSSILIIEIIEYD